MLGILILTCMRNIKDCSYEVWLNINVSLTLILQEILVDSNQDKEVNHDQSKDQLELKKAKKYVLLCKIRNIILKIILSV